MINRVWRSLTWPRRSRTSTKGTLLYMVRRAVTNQTQRRLNFDSPIILPKVIDKSPKAMPRGHWPDLRGHRLTWDLIFGYQSLRLVTSNTLVFFRRSSSISGEMARGVVPTPPPLVWWRCKKTLRMARVKRTTRRYNVYIGVCCVYLFALLISLRVIFVSNN